MQSDPAIVSTTWHLGDPPVPGAVPGFYHDGAGFWLHWASPNEARDQERYSPVEINGRSADIPWPFLDDFATRDDFISLGFIDTDP